MWIVYLRIERRLLNRKLRWHNRFYFSSLFLCFEMFRATQTLFFTENRFAFCVCILFMCRYCCAFTSTHNRWFCIPLLRLLGSAQSFVRHWGGIYGASMKSLSLSLTQCKRTNKHHHNQHGHTPQRATTIEEKQRFVLFIFKWSLGFHISWFDSISRCLNGRTFAININ